MSKNLALGLLVDVCLLLLCGAFDLDRHHDNAEILQIMEDVHNDPKCQRITKVGYLPGNPDTTVKGEHLYYIIFSDNPTKHEPRK